MNDQQKCPVTVLTGFLGSGKTSLVNALIRSDRARRFAVIVNEFGALGVDGGLIASSQDDVIQLSNGCLCCNVRGDLIETCARLATRRAEFDWLLIETSGLADPAPVAQSFLIGDGPAEAFRLDGIVCLADAVHIRGQIAREEIALRQIALADRLILTKTDLVPPGETDGLLADLRRLNPQADFLTSSADSPSHRHLTGLEAWQIGGLPARIRYAPPPRHDAGIVSLSFRYARAFDFTAFSRLIRRLMAVSGEDLLRIKGVLWLEGEDRKFAFHGVQGLAEGDVVGPWPKGPRESLIVFIGRNLDRPALEAGLADCLV
ncbi:CobW family GTP-binding protein [Pseudogemmobacter humi]|uniref:Putative GTP-binding protein YjiA n=1 Tax=Pseudogemmobacter humi TaxID=2483812 RepID=A0A3P5XFT7_9RHOB|nr:GTP-binding protein [Pseudogemmobacter humi]VDC33608.1 putative GTP-binding protein YjiA [Pseudogemmobacter humi]